MSIKSDAAATRQTCLENLQSMLKAGDVVYTKLDSVSSSGMSRVISVYIARMGDDRYYLGAIPHIVNISYLVGKATERSLTNSGGVRARGCGMDMGFELIYTLSRKLFPEGFKVTGRGRNGDTSGWDNDGGYALKQVWL